MKKITQLFVLTVLLFNSAAFAASKGDCEQTTRVAVDGLVCDFCARALEKVFGSRDEVTSIDVDLDAGFVTLLTKPKQRLDDNTLRELITDSGYNVRDISRGCPS